MIEYIETGNKNVCCGCRSCEQVCPTGALSMKNDSEGFLYPVLDTEKCIGCSLCDKSCPWMNQMGQTGQPQAYAVKNKNDAVLQKSSSGGAFSALADYVLARNGLIAGCVYDENWNPIHIIAERYETMRGSKYVQSDTGNTFTQTRELLEQGRWVLYTGTPCQIAGLKQFLKKDYGTLVTVDLVCHGVPSNWLFQEYLSYLRKKGVISDYIFRDKSKYGWKFSGSYILSKNRKTKKKYTLPTDVYKRQA